MRGPSPFTQRSPVTDPARFFGRERELQSVLARVAEPRKPQCVSIVGMRRVGKSSLLRQLSDVHVPGRSTIEAPIVCIYHDLEGSSALTVDRFFRELLRKLDKQAARAGLPPRTTTEGSDAEEALVLRLEDLSDAEVRSVFFLDEFDAVTLNPRFDADLFGRLRFLASSLQVAFVTASFAELTELCHQQEIRQSPFFNIFSTLNLGLLTNDDAARLLDVESARGGSPLTASELRLVHRLAGTHPFHLQQAAHAAWEAEPAATAGRDGVRDAFRHEAEPHFRYALAHLGEAARRGLCAAALGTGIDATAPEVRSLVRRGLLISDGMTLVPFSEEFGRFIRDQETDGPLAGAQPGTTAADPSVTAEVTLVGSVLEDRYEVLKKLGHGGFGVVFAAHDRLLDRNVAIKLLRPERGRSGDPHQRRRRLLDEAQAASRIASPHVVAVHDIRQLAQDWYVVMEFVNGQSLRQLLADHGALSGGDALSLATQAAAGLAGAHELGVVHRDIKPENMLVTAEGQLKITDFGLALMIGRGAATGDLVSAMTPRYSAPEQVLGERVGTPADVFAFGCVLFELLSGRPAFEGDTVSAVLYRILNHAPPPLVAIEHADPRLADLVRRCLQREPSLRPASGLELHAELVSLH